MAQDRNARLAAALRENLRRRKAGGRVPAPAPAPADAPESDAPESYANAPVADASVPRPNPAAKHT